MPLRRKIFSVGHKVWLTLAMCLALLFAFGVYVYAEKQVDRANELRYVSFVLADQLRQTTDDLTRMARAYVVTGDSRFRQYYQDILEIRDGRKPRPAGYLQVYWDLVVAGELPAPAGNGQDMALLELMRRAKFPAVELGKLTEAKANSDALAAIEFVAMNLVAQDGPDAQAKRARALAMMHDADYHRAKAAIMRPINETYVLMERRTADSIRSAEDTAIAFRMVFIVCLFAAMGLLWRAYAGMRGLLGGSADEVHAQMLRLGRGDFSTIIAPAPGTEDSVLAGLAKMQDKLNAHEIERRKSEAELRIAAVAFDSQEGMVITDAESVILRVNRAFTEITGYTAAEIVGKTPRLLKSDRHDADFYRAMWDSISRTGVWQGEIWDRRKNGEEYPKWLTISAVKDERGKITHYVGSHYDITNRKMAEERIQALAFFDQLTGLPNRTLLLDRLKQAMAASSRSGSHGALLFIDLDNFKTLNDTLGHDMGDALLKQVAQRLALCVREGDTVARLGGDEFVVVLAGLGSDEEIAANAVETVAEKILATLNPAYALGEVAHRSSASVGVTLFRGDSASIDDLMKQADLAMYKSKEAGRHTWRFFDPHMESAVKERATLEEDLRLAIEEKQFLLHYQIQVVGDGRLTGVEALVRWQQPQRGLVSPLEFIPLAEETGLILPLGHWVLETACRQLVTWARRSAMADLTIAVNVSAHQFGQADFVEQVLAVLDETGANPQRLKLELTESLLVHDLQEVIEKMSALKARGIGFSLDDFGTGYSSLAYLKRLPLDQLKIDQSFVRDILIDANDATIAKTIVALGQSLGLSVIAEGVETLAQRNFLAGSGCHAFQGYYFGRPLPIDELEQLVQRSDARASPQVSRKDCGIET